MPRLRITRAGDDRTGEFELVADQVQIGRTPTNDIVLQDERVSRRHTLLRRLGGSYVLTDLNSANGTFVNGQRVSQRILEDGDTITAGHCTLVFEAESAQPSVDYGVAELGATVVTRNLDQAGLATPESAVAGSAPEKTEDTVQTLRKRAETLARFYELSQALRSEFSVQEILNKVGRMLFRTTSADRYVILLKDRDTGQVVPVASEMRGVIGQTNDSITISRAVLDRVVSERTALLSLDAQEDMRLGSDSIRMQRIHSIMCAPLLRQDGVLGVIYVDSQQRGKTFTVDDLDMLNALAVQAAMAVENAMTHDQLVNEALARAAYGRFMPRHVVEQLLNDPSALNLGGSNQVITTLYADIRGFTRLAETLQPEKVVELLNEFFASVTPIVFTHGGVLDKYVGDGLMALFGVPYPSETSARDGVAAAIEMQRRIGQLNGDLARSGLPEIAIGIGLSTGTATVGYVGSDQRTDYTAIGDAVNLAARLEKRAIACQILVSSSTRAAIGDGFEVRPLGVMQMRGRSFPVDVYEVVW